MVSHSPADGSTVATLLSAASRIGGRLLAAVTTGIAKVRTAPKPLHPRGEVWTARVVRHGSDLPTGVPWFDEVGTEPALVRLSAGAGLPTGWPDVRGLALRVTVADHAADLLLATTGLGPLGRLVPLPATDTATRPYTSLIPYRGPDGAVELAAIPRGPGRFALCHATLTGPWHEFAELHLVDRDSAHLSFDPIQRPLPGLDQFAWATQLREPVYRRARRTRDEPEDVADQVTQSPADN